MFDLVSYGAFAPPAVFVLVAVLGLILALVWRRIGIGIVAVAIVCLYVLATPAFATWLLRQAEAGVTQRPDFSSAQAIVVLGADLRAGADGEPDSLGPYAVERVVYAAEAYRRLLLPVAVSGGPGDTARTPSGDLMKAALEGMFGIPVKWDENRSRTTWENAADTAPLLTADGIKAIVVVTHAWHMRRALWCFERFGLHAVPWPASRTALRVHEVADFLPRTGALEFSFFALHELIGGIYYRMRH